MYVLDTCFCVIDIVTMTGFKVLFFGCSYDPLTDSWTAVAALSGPRDAVGVCVLGDCVVAVGGFDGQDYLSDAERYDPHTNEWTKVCMRIHFCRYR